MSTKILCFGILLTICEVPEQPKTTTVICPPIVPWSQELQKRSAVELRKMPKGSATAELIARAIEQRNINRRCQDVR